MRSLLFKKYTIKGKLKTEMYTLKNEGEAILRYEFDYPVNIVSIITDEYLPDSNYDLIKYYVSLYKNSNTWDEITPLNRDISSGNYFIKLPIKSKIIYIKIKMKLSENGEAPWVENLTIKGK